MVLAGPRPDRGRFSGWGDPASAYRERDAV